MSGIDKRRSPRENISWSSKDSSRRKIHRKFQPSEVEHLSKVVWPRNNKGPRCGQGRREAIVKGGSRDIGGKGRRDVDKTNKRGKRKGETGQNIPLKSSVLLEGSLYPPNLPEKGGLGKLWEEHGRMKETHRIDGREILGLPLL